MPLNTLKLLSVSDIHDKESFRTWIEAQTVDILFLPGDIIDMFGLLTGRQSKTARDWVLRLTEKFKMVAVSSGNHDDAELEWISSLSEYNIPNLVVDNECKTATIQGIKLAIGCATNNWLDNPQLQELNTKLIEGLARTQADFRFLLHHTPPRPSPIGAQFDGDLDGIYLKELLDENFTINVVFSGHIHSCVQEQGVWYHQLGRTLCLNSGQYLAGQLPVHIRGDITRDALKFTWVGYNQDWKCKSTVSYPPVS